MTTMLTPGEPDADESTDHSPTGQRPQHVQDTEIATDHSCEHDHNTDCIGQGLVRRIKLTSGSSIAKT